MNNYEFSIIGYFKYPDWQTDKNKKASTWRCGSLLCYYIVVVASCKLFLNFLNKLTPTVNEFKVSFRYLRTFNTCFRQNENKMNKNYRLFTFWREGGVSKMNKRLLFVLCGNLLKGLLSVFQTLGFKNQKKSCPRACLEKQWVWTCHSLTALYPDFAFWHTTFRLLQI